MGVTTDGILAYGFDVGGPEEGWLVTEAGEYGEWSPRWYDEDEGVELSAETALLRSVGFIETDWHTPGYHERKREAQARVGVELVPYQSGDFPKYVVATHEITVGRGRVKMIDWVQLDLRRVRERWDDGLRVALRTLGATPNQEEPGWLLASYYGY